MANPYDQFSSPNPYDQFEKTDRSGYLPVVANAAWKGVANLPDMLLNTPDNLLNLGRAAVGTVTNLAGRPDLSPDIKPTPDFARRGAEAVGLINPNVVPQGLGQKAADVLVQGATGGALTGGTSLPQTLINAGMGALSAGTGAATEALTGSKPLGIAASIAAPAAASRVAGGMQLRPDAETLNKAGVKMTPGQMAGGTLQRIEDALTSVPLLGDAIKSAQRRGFESFGVAAANGALKPIGEKIPSGVKGNEAVGYAQDKLGSAYNSLRDRMKGSLDGPTQAPGVTALPSPNPTPTLRMELDNIKTMGANLPKDQSRQLNDIIQSEIIDRFPKSPGSVASGETIKNIESQLGNLSKTMGRSENYDVRKLGLAVKEAQASVRRMVERENPQHAAELEKINEGWAIFKRVQGAASSVASKDGVFTPAQLHAAVKNQDISKDKAKFARGDALMQDFSGAGKNVLSQTVPDSGTATRALVEGGLLGAGSLGAYMYEHPVLGALGAGATLAGTLPYTPWGQTAIQSVMANKRPQFSTPQTGLASLLYK